MSLLKEKSFFFGVLYKKFKVIGEMLEWLCDIANKLIVFDGAILF